MPRIPSRLWRAAPAAVLLALSLLATACGRDVAPPSGGKLQASAVASTEDAGTVDLRVYLRAGSGTDAHLLPVTRRAAIGTDLPRRALELLIAGPIVEDPKDTKPVLPAATMINAFSVEGHTAVVELSAEVVTDAGRVGASPEHELLALAAVANTLTEFPAIDQVRLSVAGGARDFWGGWGLPELLTRDEEVVGAPREGDPLPPLTRFTTQAQRVGSTEATAVAISDVRTRDRVGFVRVIVELTEPGGDVPARSVPITTAVMEGDRLVLQIDDVVSSAGNPAPGQRLALEGLPFDALEAEAGQLPGPARFALPTGGQPFWLHTLTSPTRVVLDVRK